MPYGKAMEAQHREAVLRRVSRPEGGKSKRTVGLRWMHSRYEDHGVFAAGARIGTEDFTIRRYHLPLVVLNWDPRTRKGGLMVSSGT